MTAEVSARIYRSYVLLGTSDPAEGTEASVHRHHDAVHEAGGRAAEPDQGPDQIIRFSEAPCRGVLDYGMSPLREVPLFVEQMGTILPPDKEPRRHGVDSESRTVD